MNTKVGIINVSNGYHSGFTNGIYIGRGGKGKAQSPLANPYSLNKHSREESLKLYKEWLMRKLKDRNSPQSMEFNKLKLLLSHGSDLNLICFCHPKPCHGDIIKLLLESNAQLSI